MQNKRVSFSVFLLFLLSFFSFLSSWSCCSTLFSSDFLLVEDSIVETTVKIQGIFGQTVVSEPVLVDLFRSPEVGRLMKIRQHGNWHFCGQEEEYNRFEHSVNVFLLVRRAGGSLLEQVAALLHDVSHTVFSHAGATFFEDDFLKADHLQDDMHQFYLERGDVARILNKHGITIESVMPERGDFFRLEQDLPALCSDRIEYNITGSLYEGLITRNQAELIIKSLHFSTEAKSWYFDDSVLAYIFARNAAYMAIAVWTSPYSVVSSKMLGYALRRAGQLGLLTKEDILFGSDDEVFEKMYQSSDDLLKQFLLGVSSPGSVFALSPEKVTCDSIVCKFRGVDPLVLCENSLLQLSEVNRSFAWYLSHMQMLFQAGWPVVYNDFIARAIKELGVVVK